MQLPTRIYLTGFMGSGKSTLGPMVANVLGYDFVDLDETLEAVFGSSISAFFQAQGEEAFRAEEARQLRETAALSRTVVSLGGGALAREENLRFALASGLVVYLRWSAADLAHRLSRSTDRPLLYGPTGETLPLEALELRIEEMLANREPFYLQANVCVELGRQPVGYSVDEVVNAIRRWRRGRGGRRR